MRGRRSEVHGGLLNISHKTRHNTFSAAIPEIENPFKILSEPFPDVYEETVVEIMVIFEIWPERFAGGCRGLTAWWPDPFVSAAGAADNARERGRRRARMPAGRV
jgi:hypothetical protein